MKKINLILMSAIFLINILFVTAQTDSYACSGFGMMSGSYGFGMMFFGWIFSLLILVVLVLFIVWLVKQIQGKKWWK